MVERNPVIEKKSANYIMIALYAFIVFSFLITIIDMIIRFPLQSQAVDYSDIQLIVINILGIIIQIVFFTYGLYQAVKGTLSPKRMGVVIVAYFGAMCITGSEFKMNSKLMLELRTEIDHIVYRYSRGGYVDWYHASEFTSELRDFLNTKVMLLIEKNCLKQAFELTNLVFQCIGNIDMDDSDGGSSFVANACYECWKQIIEKSDEIYRNEIKSWFETHQAGYVIDIYEEYMEEILFEFFATEEMITKEIKKLDNFINKRLGSDCGTIYSVHYGFENPIIKRIEYMKKINYTAEQIEEYKQANRRFFVIRELEISEAIKNNDYDTAIKMLKACIVNPDQWSKMVDDIVMKSRYENFVCQLLYEEKRYDELMNKIEQSSNKVSLLDSYDKILRKIMPERVIKIYSAYLKQAAEIVNGRKKYKYLMPYLKKISKCDGRKAVAEDIAATWRREYKRRTAMMDELRKAGF